MASSIPIQLTPFQNGDYESYRLLTKNPRVMEMITGRALSGMESITHFELLLQQNDVKAGFGNFKITRQDTGDFIGLAKLVLEDKASRQAEIGFMLLEKYWGKGIASVVTRQMIEFCRSQSDLLRLKAILDPLNKASRRILVKEGFVSEFLGEIDGLPGEVMSLVL